MSESIPGISPYDESKRFDYDPLLVAQLQSFVRRLSNEFGFRSNAMLKIDSGNYWKVSHGGFEVTPEMVDEVCQAIVDQLEPQEIGHVLDTAENGHIFDVLQKKLQAFGYSHRTR